MFCIKLKNVSVNKEIYCDWIAEKRELIFASSWQNETIYSTLSDLDPNDWERMKAENGWHSVQLRDNRYNQIIHMVSAANGAEPFYTLDGHNTRHEGLETARKLDEITAAVRNLFFLLNLCDFSWLHSKITYETY